MTAVAISFDETAFDFEEFGRFKEEMLAGKEADGGAGGGGGGGWSSGKNGRLSGGDAAVVGVKGMVDGGGGTVGESCGKNGWWSLRRLSVVVVVEHGGRKIVVMRSEIKIRVFMGIWGFLRD